MRHYIKNDDVNRLIPAPDIKTLFVLFRIRCHIKNVTFIIPYSYMEISININIDFKNQTYTMILE